MHCLCAATLALLIPHSLVAVDRSTVTVDGLRQVIAGRIAAHAKDDELARQLGSLDLTERLTEQSLNGILAEPLPGPKTREAIQLLADSSAFLDPPPSELPHKPAPDTAEQQRMMNAAVNFVAVTLHQMPDFLADRETRSFDDSPLAVTHSGWAPSNIPLHLAGTFREEVTYRNGREVGNHSVSTSGADTKQGVSPPGLTSSGEFGSVLATVLVDDSKGIVSWSHWEQTPNGLASVFHYQVPLASSHYEVNFCCVRGSEDAKNYSGELDSSANSYRGTPAYHGSLIIDPVTGAVLGITIETELGTKEPIMRSAISVSYGPAEIGGKTYTCPLRSVAISLARTHLDGDMGDRTILRINEVKFINYHRFGSTVRIVPTSSVPE